MIGAKGRNIKLSSVTKTRIKENSDKVLGIFVLRIGKTTSLGNRTRGCANFSNE